MKTYITFGQAHAHHVNGITFDKDLVAVIEAPNYKEARDRAFELFGRQWAFAYPEDEWTEKKQSYFPRGCAEVE